MGGCAVVSLSPHRPPRQQTMAHVRPRSSSPTANQAHHKKPKTSHPQDDAVDVDSNFAAELFDASNVDQLRTSYADSTPFKHVVLDALFRDDLLRGVKDECLKHLSFTEKETDIYKVDTRRVSDDPSLIRSLARSTKPAISPPSPTSPTSSVRSSRTSSPFVMPSTPPASVPFSSP